MNLNAVTYCRKCLKIDLSRFLRFLAFKYFHVRDPTTLIVSQTRCERSHQTFIPTRGLLERKYRSWNSFLNRIVSGPKLLSSFILLSTLHVLVEIERYESLPDRLSKKEIAADFVTWIARMPRRVTFNGVSSPLITLQLERPLYGAAS